MKARKFLANKTYKMCVFRTNIGCVNCPHNTHEYPVLLERKEEKEEKTSSMATQPTIKEEPVENFQSDQSDKSDQSEQDPEKPIKIEVTPEIESMIKSYESEDCVCGFPCGEKVRDLHTNLLEFCPDLYEKNVKLLDGIMEEFGRLAVQDELSLMEDCLTEIGKQPLLCKNDENILDIE